LLANRRCVHKTEIVERERDRRKKKKKKGGERRDKTGRDGKWRNEEREGESDMKQKNKKRRSLLWSFS